MLSVSAEDEVRGQYDSWARFAVILYDNNTKQFVFSARRYNNTTSSYICQFQQQGLSIIYLSHSTEYGLSPLLFIKNLSRE